MIITKLPIEVPVLLIKNLFDEEERARVVEEFKFLCKPYKLQPPGETGSAVDPVNNVYLKSNNGIFIDNVYAPNYRGVSDILTVTRKYFNLEVIEQIEKQDVIFKYLRRSDFDVTLLSYYENNDYYEPHEDKAILTIIAYYWKQPKMFSGGDLTFTDYNYTFTPEPWDVIIFPSFIKHQVSQVELLPGVQRNQFNGRIALSTFVNNRGV